MTFPNAHSIIYRNEEGEVLGWDNPTYDEPEYFDCCGVTGRCVCDDLEEEEEIGDDDTYDEVALYGSDY